MNRYTKKPVTIEAMQFTAESKDRCFEFVTCSKVADFDESGDGDGVPLLRIETFEGYMTARPGDWIIKGIKGEFYPCRADIFEATYGAADGPTPSNDDKLDEVYLLNSAAIEIKSLRRQNEILQAKVSVMDLFAAALHAQPNYGPQGMSVDVAWQLEQRAEKISAK